LIQAQQHLKRIAAAVLFRILTFIPCIVLQKCREMKLYGMAGNTTLVLDKMVTERRHLLNPAYQKVCATQKVEV